MRRNVDALRSREFDLAIVGGGISGACLAHDAALRGLSVALIEQRDFASATSSASSKLLHGGIRYLQQVQLSKVRESAFECASFQVIAPHLTRYVPFLIPTYRGVARGRAMLATGLSLYEALTAGQNRGISDAAKRVPSSRYCPLAEVIRLAPVLSGEPGLTGAYVLYESHIYNSERLALAFLKTADSHGAVIANYVAAEGFVSEPGAVRGVQARDMATNDALTIRARVVANAAGPWIMKLNGTLAIDRLHRNITTFSKGAHIVTRQLVPEYALALGTSQKAEAVIDRGGRHVFVIPWRGRSLIGTTNVPFAGGPGFVTASAGDARGLVDDINRALPSVRLTIEDVSYAYAGLYPLTEEVIRTDVYQGTGHYQIVDHSQVGGIDGLISVLGAKYTTARRLAELTTNMVETKLGKSISPCTTSESPIAGGGIRDLSEFTRAAIDRFGADISDATVRHLVASYGTEIDTLLAAGQSQPGGRRRLVDDRESLEAEVTYGVEHEMAIRLDDVVFRRTGLGTLGHPGRACLERCAAIMANPLGWSAAEVDHQIQETESLFPRLIAT